MNASTRGNDAIRHPVEAMDPRKPPADQIAVAAMKAARRASTATKALRTNFLRSRRKHRQKSRLFRGFPAEDGEIFLAPKLWWERRSINI
jgi:hypothetical protein